MTETVQAELIGSFAAVLVAIVGLVGHLTIAARIHGTDSAGTTSLLEAVMHSLFVPADLIGLDDSSDLADRWWHWSSFGSEDCVVGVQ